MITLITFKTPFFKTLVGLHVSFQVALDSKGFITEVAVIRLLLSVTPLMLQNVSLESKSLWTKFTLIFLLNASLLGCVTSSHVSPEVTSGLELLRTNVTLMSSHACVGGHMVLTEGFTGEKLGTEVTCEHGISIAWDLMMNPDLMFPTQLLRGE